MCSEICTTIPLPWLGLLLATLNPSRLHGSALSPFLFNVVLDTISAHIQDQSPWLMMYANNIPHHIDESQLMLERKVNLWKGTLDNGGLETEYMACGSPDSSTVHIGPEPVVKSEKFRYLGLAYVGCKCLAISVNGVRPPGCPRKRLLDVVMQDMRGNGLATEDA